MGKHRGPMVGYSKQPSRQLCAAWQLTELRISGHSFPKAPSIEINVLGPEVYTSDLFWSPRLRGTRFSVSDCACFWCQTVNLMHGNLRLHVLAFGTNLCSSDCAVSGADLCSYVSSYEHCLAITVPGSMPKSKNASILSGNPEILSPLILRCTCPNPRAPTQCLKL